MGAQVTSDAVTLLGGASSAREHHGPTIFFQWCLFQLTATAAPRTISRRLVLHVIRAVSPRWATAVSRARSPNIHSTVCNLHARYWPELASGRPPSVIFQRGEDGDATRAQFSGAAVARES